MGRIAMLKQIVQKEIQIHIKELRFLISFVLILILMISSGLLFVRSYRQKVVDYRRVVNENNRVLKRAAQSLRDVATSDQIVVKSPNKLELCAEGGESLLPNAFVLNAFDMLSMPQNEARANFMMPRFRFLDWVFVFSIILSFIAFLMTYDVVSGEKQQGTLGLLLSNPISRATVLLGKYLGAIICLTLPVVLGLVLNLLIVSLSPLISFSGSEWMKILTIGVASMVYLSVFVLIGLFVSASTRAPVTSGIVLLFIWIFSAVVVPHSVGMLAGKFYPLPTKGFLERYKRAQDQIWWDAPDAVGRFCGRPDPFADYYPLRHKVLLEVAAVRNRLYDGYLKQMIDQVRYAQNVIRLSPTSVYQHLCEAVAGVGVLRFEQFYQQVKKYRSQLRDFIVAEDRKDPESAHLINFEGDGISEKPVDFDAIPRFREKPIPMSDSLRYALWDVVLLILFNLVFFALAFVAFLRYDVR